jgi:beta-barrel assembly-enhancing protease
MGGSMSRRIKWTAAVAALVLSAGAWSQAGRLPALGESEVWTLGQEQRLGDDLRRSLYQGDEVLEDGLLGDYLAHIWAPLFESAQRQGFLTPALAQRFDWTLLVINDRAVNAFAMPGGVVGVNVGLLAMTDQPAQVAAVLAHELSHVTQRHIPRLLERQNQVTPLAVGAMLLAVVAASQGGGDGAQAAFIGGQAALAQTGINFTRSMEREADRIGWMIYQGAQYPQAGFGAMFTKLYESSRLSDDGDYPYLRTHPLNHERLAEVAVRQQGSVPEPERSSPVNERWGQWMQARAQVLSTQRTEDWAAWQQLAQALPQRALTAAQQVTLYKGALSAWKLGAHAQAWSWLQTLAQQQQQFPDVGRVIRSDQLALWATPGEVLAANDVVQPWVAEGLGSKRRGEWLAAAHAALRLGQPAAVVSKAQSWVVTQPLDGPAWDVLALAREQQGQVLRTLRAQAEAQEARGNSEGAIDRLVAAQRWSRDHPQQDPVEAQVVLTRERALRQAMVDRQKESESRP